MANNDMDNQDFEPDFDQGGDFDEFDTGAEKVSVGSAISGSPVLKIALVGALVLVVVGAIALFGGDEKDLPGSRVDSGASDLKQTPGKEELTPMMRNAVEEHNQQVLDEALKTGTSAIPTPIDPPKVMLGVPEGEAVAEDPLVRWKRLQEERLRLQREQEQFVAQGQTDPQRDERIAGLRDAMLNQVSNIMGERGIQGMQNMKVITDVQFSQAGAAGAAAGTGNLTLAGAGQGQTTNTTPLEPQKILLPAGEVEYAQLLMEANSDVPGPIVAMLVSGPFSGSKVIGSFKREDEYLVMEFTTLVTKDGYSVPISAIAVDPDSTLGAMATDVDHRYFRRVVLPAAVSFIEGMGQAIADNGTTSVTVNGDTTVSQESNDLDTEQELATAASEAATKVGEILDEELDVEILVRVKAGTPMGLLFTTSVTDKAVEAAAYGVTAGAQQGQTQYPYGQPQQNPYYYPVDANGNPMQMLQQGLQGQVQIQQQGNGYQASIPGAQVTFTNGGTQ